MRAYIVLSLLIGARTEELRALLWSHVVAYDEARAAWLPVSRAAGSTTSSRPTSGDPSGKRAKPRPSSLGGRSSCPSAAWPRWACSRTPRTSHRRRRETTGRTRTSCSAHPTGTPLTAHNVRRDFRKVAEGGRTPGREWSLRKLRHSFVSVLSDSGIPIKDISRLVGHSNMVVTETVYRHQIRPVIMQGLRQWTRSLGISRSDTSSKITHKVFSQVGGTGFEPVTPRL
ncbi:tyrosine-type recombinase/integrase [Nonomuraea insulae]|uniref:Tyrosine-type recombinase/integrase n=1 Tax=Nonomuraea insulae TaxID=1616787 RepID=A0ABW1CDM4_9ACTN